MRNSDRIYAITGTVLFHALLLIALLFSFLRFPPEEVEEWPPEPKNEIVFDEMEELYAAGDFVRTGDNLNDYVPTTQRHRRLRPLPNLPKTHLMPVIPG